MKNKNLTIGILLLSLLSISLYSFIPSKKENPQTASSQYMMVDVVETITISDGKMIVTSSDGTSNVTDLKNYYGGFVSTKSITTNDKTILDELDQLRNQGWELDKTISSTMSGLSITRYILKKNQ